MSIAANDSSILYAPGVWDVTGGRALTVNPGARFSTLLVGNPTAISFGFDVTQQPSEKTRIAIQIDGQGWTNGDVAATVTVPIPARTAAWTKHLVEVMVIATSDSFPRWDVSGTSVAVKFTGITTTPGSVTAVAPTARALRGLALGDSIVEGINTLTAASGANTTRSDARLGWASTLADTLGAEIGVVGFGTQGIVHPGLGGVPAFSSTWNKIAAGISRTLTGLDFIAINHGTNDNGFGHSTADFKTGYISTLNAMLAASTCPIMPMLPFNGAYGASVFNQIVAATDSPPRVRFIDTTGWFSSSDTGDGTHPYGYTDLARLAGLAADAIRDRLGSAGSTYVYNGTAWVPDAAVVVL